MTRTNDTEKLEASRNRVKNWTGTVHYADEAGRPACHAAGRTHSSWFEFTIEAVTCGACVKKFGADTPADTRKPLPVDPVIANRERRAAERAARQAAAPPLPNEVPTRQTAAHVIGKAAKLARDRRLRFEALAAIPVDLDAAREVELQAQRDRVDAARLEDEADRRRAEDEADHDLAAADGIAIEWTS